MFLLMIFRFEVQLSFGDRVIQLHAFNHPLPLPLPQPQPQQRLDISAWFPFSPCNPGESTDSKEGWEC